MRYRFLNERGEPTLLTLVSSLGQSLRIDGDQWAILDAEGATIKQGTVEAVADMPLPCSHWVPLADDPTREGPCILAAGHWEPCRTVRAMT